MNNLYNYAASSLSNVFERPGKAEAAAAAAEEEGEEEEEEDRREGDDEEEEEEEEEPPAAKKGRRAREKSGPRGKCAEPPAAPACGAAGSDGERKGGDDGDSGGDADAHGGMDAVVAMFRARLLRKAYRPGSGCGAADGEVEACEREFKAIAAGARAEGLVNRQRWNDVCEGFSNRWPHICHWLHPSRLADQLSNQMQVRYSFFV
ncbi:hypothetical protein DIPPA_35017 [Diplonema papillatum]|nr:hypothetical protein DIPPA_35017 [Diplonema papillatum]